MYAQKTHKYNKCIYFTIFYFFLVSLYFVPVLLLFCVVVFFHHSTVNRVIYIYMCIFFSRHKFVSVAWVIVFIFEALTYTHITY